MSASWSTIREALYDWAAAAVPGTPVIWAEQNAAPPAVPYVTLRLASNNQVGQDATLPPDAVTGIGEIVGNLDFTLGLQAYGTGALSLIDTLRSSLSKPSVRGTLRAGNVIYVDSLGSTNLTGIIPNKTEYEERESLDLLMRTWSETTDDLGVIEKVSGTAGESGEYTNTPSGSPIDRTLTVDAS